MKLLRFAGLYLAHLLTALFITAHSSRRRSADLLGPAAPLGMVQREWILSIACAAAIGLLMFRTWRWRGALWVWVLPTLWFGLNILLTMNRFGGAWYYLSGVACAEGFARPSSCTEWFFATIPFIRAVAYSLGTLAGMCLFAGRPALLGTQVARREENPSGAD